MMISDANSGFLIVACLPGLDTFLFGRVKAML